MKTTLSLSAPADIETEALVAVVLDHGEKDKPQIKVDSSDAAIKDAAADVFASGEAVRNTSISAASTNCWCIWLPC